jgi:hypothetical protein
MGFKDARAMVVAALQSGQFRHEQRADAAEKNLLDAGEVTAGFVADLLLRCSGIQYESSHHHSDPDLLCHIFKPELRGERWYVKVFILSSVAVFISVHR